jgi:hypothetical protein
MDIHSIFQIDSPRDFEQFALETFQFQYRQVPVYKEFCDHLGIIPRAVNRIDEIPFLPIELFKSHQILQEGLTPETVFRSSGTTGSTRSSHYVADLSVYRESFIRGFEYFYGSPADYCILALLPSYREREDASLVYMVSELIRLSGDPDSGFIDGDPADTVLNKLEHVRKKRGRVLLLGVSFALLDLALYDHGLFQNAIVMETGGMKGRRTEMVREELHRILSKKFGLFKIHSEYGMTELLSQAYSKGDGLFRCPPWMQVLIRDSEDPFAYLGHGRTGGVNIIDLANRHSCAFLATQDLGRLYPDGSFEVLGRFDHSDVRGCNLMAI